jgi:hypothetical protein
LIRREEESTTSSTASSPRSAAVSQGESKSEAKTDGATVTFNFKETEPNTSTFGSRFFHFINVTWMPNWLATDEEIQQGVDTVAKYKKLAANSPNGDI